MWSKKWEKIAATLQSVFSNTHNTNRLCCPFWKSLQKRIDKENLYGLISNHCSNSFSKIFITKKSSKSQNIFFYITLLYSRYSFRVEEVVNMEDCWRGVSNLQASLLKSQSWIQDWKSWWQWWITYYVRGLESSYFRPALSLCQPHNPILGICSTFI